MEQVNDDKILEKILPIQIRIEIENPENCSGDCRFIFSCNEGAEFIVLCGLHLKKLDCDMDNESFKNVKRCPQCLAEFGV